MAEYISKEKALNFEMEIEAAPDEIPAISKGIAYYFDYIESIQTTDVEERKTGTWIVDRKYGNDVLSNERMVICSNCLKGIFWGKQNYCPNCGARMVTDDV